MKLTKTTIKGQDTLILTIEMSAPELYRLEEMVEAAAVVADDYSRCEAAVEMNERLRTIERQAHAAFEVAKDGEKDGLVESADGLTCPGTFGIRKNHGKGA